MHQVTHHEVSTTHGRSSMINLSYSQVHQQGIGGGPSPQFISTREINTPPSINRPAQQRQSYCFSESRTPQDTQQVYMTQSFIVPSPNFNHTTHHSHLDGQRSRPMQLSQNTFVRHSNIEIRQPGFQQSAQTDKLVSYNGDSPYSMVRREGSQNMPPAFVENPLQQSISPAHRYHSEATFSNSVQSIQPARTPFFEIVNGQQIHKFDQNSNYQRKSFDIQRNVSLNNFFDFDQNRNVSVHPQNNNIGQHGSVQEYVTRHQVRHTSFNRLPDANTGFHPQKAPTEYIAIEDPSPKMTSLSVSLVDFNQNSTTNPQHTGLDLVLNQDSLIQNDSHFSKNTSQECRTNQNTSSMIAANNSNLKPVETVDRRVSILDFEREVVSESETMSTDAICDKKGSNIQQPQTRRNFQPTTPDTALRDKFANSSGRNTLSLSAEKPKRRNSKMYNQSMINLNSANKKSILKKKSPFAQRGKKKVCINEEDNTKYLVDNYLHQLSSVESVDSRNYNEPQIIFVPQLIQQPPVFNYPNGQVIQRGRSFTDALANLQGRFTVVQNTDMSPQGMVYTQYVHRK